MADSSQIPQDAGFWGAVAAAIAAMAAFLRRPSRVEIQKIRGALNDHILKDETRLTALETIAQTTPERLARIEQGQEEISRQMGEMHKGLTERIDRLIARGK